MKSKIQHLLFFLLISVGTLFAQKGQLTGVVAEDGEGLIGVAIQVDGTTLGTVTELDGTYTMILDPGDYSITASYVGYTSVSQPVTIVADQTTTLDFNLKSGVLVDEVVILGTRASNRTNTDSPVPVDVINVDKLTVAAPQTTVNSILTYTAPSFNSNTQTISDGTDHIDPASLRGLGPDQVLVLLNGKRRHTTSLVNVNGTFGRGNVGTDMNTIPAIALENIEVLRDGAAAQYGSDAIAGVINLRLKEDINKLNFKVTTGANFTSEIGPFGGETRDIDGELFNLGVNYGLPLGNKGGLISLSGEYNRRGSTNRMLEFDAGIFNGLNAVERVATDSLFDIENLTANQIKNIAGGLNNIFTAEEIATIQGFTEEELHTPSGDGFVNPLFEDATDAELAARGQTASDYNMRVGQSALRGGKLFANMVIPVAENMEVYGFGGIGFRRGTSGCFYRLPSQSRTVTAVHIDGTVPRINSNITDRSVAGGIRGMVRSWNVDLSNTYGFNQFNYQLSHSNNATLGASSPTDFDIGGHSFTQNTTNFDVSQYFDDALGLAGINVAFGAEYRFENYQVTPGVENSYGNYDVNGNLVNSVTPDSLKATDFFGRSRPSGCQCFAGFLPSNFVDANRNSVAGYLDTEFDITDAFLIGAAIRVEDYSDFGETFNYKLAARYKITDNINIRAATATGFRAPSLHQINFNKTATIFSLVNGVSVPQEVGTFSNNSRAASLLGIPNLTEETSQSFSAGVTAKIPDANLKITVDGYYVTIDDRVVFTGRFAAGDDEELGLIFEQAGATAAAFFANAISTESQGIDLVISHSAAFNRNMTLRNDLAATFAQTKWDQDAGINASALLERKGLVGTYFNQEARIYLEQAVPRVKVTLSNTLDIGKLSIYLRNTYFGETTEATNEPIFDDDLNLLSDDAIADNYMALDDDLTQEEALELAERVNDPYNSPKIITDLSLGYDISDNLNITIGANNLLDVYPDLVDDGYRSSGRFIYSRRSPQFSFGGRFLFARVGFTLE